MRPAHLAVCQLGWSHLMKPDPVTWFLIHWVKVTLQLKSSTHHGPGGELLHTACCCGVVAACLLLFSQAAPLLSKIARNHRISQNIQRFCNSKCYGLKEWRSRWRLSSVGWIKKLDIQSHATLMSYQSCSNYQFSSLKSCSCQRPSDDYKRKLLFFSLCLWKLEEDLIIQ